MGRIKPADSTHRATVSLRAGNNALAYSMVLAARNTAGAPRAAKTASEAVIVQRVTAVVGNARVLLQCVSVIPMSAAIAGLVAEMALLMDHHLGEITTHVTT